MVLLLRAKKVQTLQKISILNFQLKTKSQLF